MYVDWKLRTDPGQTGKAYLFTHHREYLVPARTTELMMMTLPASSLQRETILLRSTGTASHQLEAHPSSGHAENAPTHCMTALDFADVKNLLCGIKELKSALPPSLQQLKTHQQSYHALTRDGPTILITISQPCSQQPSTPFSPASCRQLTSRSSVSAA